GELPDGSGASPRRPKTHPDVALDREAQDTLVGPQGRGRSHPAAAPLDPGFIVANLQFIVLILERYSDAVPRISVIPILAPAPLVLGNAFLFTQPVAIRRGIIPRDVMHGVTVQIADVRHVGVAVAKASELLQRHQLAGQRERTPDPLDVRLVWPAHAEFRGPW